MLFEQKDERMVHQRPSWWIHLECVPTGFISADLVGSLKEPVRLWACESVCHPMLGSYNISAFDAFVENSVA